MRAALYVRVSTDDKNQTVETQLFALRRYCKDAGCEIVKEYADEARAKDFTARKAWAELQKDAKQHKFQTVLVFKLDRAFRSVRECENTLQEWGERGIGFRSITQDSIDTTTSMGKFVLQILAAAAELESSLISDRVKAGMNRAAAEGTRTGKPIGKPRLKITLDDIEAVLTVNNYKISSTARDLKCSRAYIRKRLIAAGLAEPGVPKRG